jgi:hypothetical protein
MRILRYITLSLALSSGFSTADNYGKFETYIPENQKVIADVMIISTPTAVQE